MRVPAWQTYCSGRPVPQTDTKLAEAAPGLSVCVRLVYHAATTLIPCSIVNCLCTAGCTTSGMRITLYPCGLRANEGVPNGTLQEWTPKPISPGAQDSGSRREIQKRLPHPMTSTSNIYRAAWRDAMYMQHSARLLIGRRMAYGSCEGVILRCEISTTKLAGRCHMSSYKERYEHIHAPWSVSTRALQDNDRLQKRSV